jgi:hypothetical protein
MEFNHMMTIKGLIFNNHFSRIASFSAPEGFKPERKKKAPANQAGARQPINLTN